MRSGAEGKKDIDPEDSRRRSKTTRDAAKIERSSECWVLRLIVKFRSK